MNKIFNYQKNGPGVSKAAGRTERVTGFWRIYKDKFFQLLGLNLIFCLCLLIVIGISSIPLSKVLDDKTDFSKTLKSEYNLSSGVISVFDRMVDAYKIDDTRVDKASVHFTNAIKLLNSKNKDALSQQGSDGKLKYDSNKFSQKEKAYIAAEAIKGFEELGFSVKVTDGKYNAEYSLYDSSKTKVAVLTYTYGKEGKSDSVYFEHYLPYNLAKVGMILLCFFPVVLLGPVKIGITRLTRDYVREEPTFMMSDFWDTIKKNWWQSFVISFIEYIATGCSMLSLIWYFGGINSGNIFHIIGFAACLFLSYIFISMHFYVPMMQVTLDLNLRKIYKNAFFFTVICMLKNVGMILLGAILIVALLLLVFVVGAGNPFVLSLTITLMLIAGFSFWFYFLSYNTYPAIKKYVIDPYYEAKNKPKEQDEADNGDGDDGAPSVASGDEEAPSDDNDDNDDDDSDDLPEYVYHNGRMVHRSVLEQQNLFDDDVT